jgi:hypothetical protein
MMNGLADPRDPRPVELFVIREIRVPSMIREIRVPSKCR